ncbi:MAG: Heat-inducible transcription repressor HrcA [Deltaproteobacteria bacterium ADurb.Bin510]|nr:MAG: Heat-inducible transcription repressor HrcA [Deltaproteobacteria bacterium ADurb.Bin510]
MADLDELGYLFQPHVSAGRLPTPEAFRYYLAEIVELKDLAVSDKSLIRDHMSRVGGDFQQSLREASHLLSEISQSAAIIILPKVGSLTFKRIELLRLDRQRILVILVNSAGLVYNHVISGEDLPQDDLATYANYLNATFAGLTIQQMRDRLLDEMSSDKARFDKMVRQALVIGQRAMVEVDSPPDVVIDGKSTVLSHPGVSDLSKLKELVAAFEDKGRMVKLLNRMLEVPGVKVLLGDDMGPAGMDEFTMVASGYSRGGTPVGSLGVIGPLRMDYGRVIPLVEYMSRVLSSVLEDI